MIKLDDVNILKLTQQLEDALPQTQCTKCGYPDCRGYAQALAENKASHNRCPPGGSEGIARLAQILKRDILPLDQNCGIERPRPVAKIDPKQCIGCTLCIKACPVDAIVGAAKQMHVVLEDRCTGCDLCVPPCPVDCIEMIPITGTKTGWQAWSSDLAQISREHYESRKIRLVREKADHEKKLANKAASKLAALDHENPESEAQRAEVERKRAIIAAAIARAKEKLSQT